MSPWKLLVPDLIECTHDAAHEIPEFRWGVIADQVEFLDGVRRRGITKQVIRHLVIVHAIQKEIVGLLAVPIDERSRAAVTLSPLLKLLGSGWIAPGEKASAPRSYEWRGEAHHWSQNQ